MRYVAVLLIFFGMAFSGCGRGRRNFGQTETLDRLIGKPVTLRGTAVDRKGGAALMDGESFVWVDGLDRWPDEFRSRVVEVAGLLIEDTDPSVFIDKPDDPIVQGTPVRDSAEFAEANHRYVLQQGKWSLSR